MASGTVVEAHAEDYHFFHNPFQKAINLDEHTVPDSSIKLFLTRPLYAPLLLPNVSSDARDHATNERTFLSWLRLSMYLNVVAVAIFINFHLKHEPTRLEEHMSHPLGIIFWILGLSCLVSGAANYIRTVSKYARRRAIVQHGMKTQFVFGFIATSIIAACGLFIGADAEARRTKRWT